MRLNKGRFTLIGVCGVWGLMIGVGLCLLWAYENAPGPVVAPPSQWPADSRIHLATDRATLVMLAHPHCPCTRASIGELARLMTQAQGRVTTYVLFLKPPDFSDDWEKTDLWQSAASIPGVNVIVDEGGVEAQRFQAVTSGQIVLYDALGCLLFSGGITGSRGHFGDNAGQSAIVSLLNTGKADRSETFAFGCPLFSADSECRGGVDERTNR
ncbi:MAG: RedB protein [Blastocatellia bacterium]